MYMINVWLFKDFMLVFVKIYTLKVKIVKSTHFMHIPNFSDNYSINISMVRHRIKLYIFTILRVIHIFFNRNSFYLWFYKDNFQVGKIYKIKTCETVQNGNNW